MKVILNTLMAGPKGIFHPGQTINRTAKECQALIKGGYARSPVEPAPKKKPPLKPQYENTDSE